MLLMTGLFPKQRGRIICVLMTTQLLMIWVYPDGWVAALEERYMTHHTRVTTVCFVAEQLCIERNDLSENGWWTVEIRLPHNTILGVW